MKLKEDLYKRALELLEKEIKKYKIKHQEIDYRKLILKYRANAWKPFLFRLYENLCKKASRIIKVDKKAFNKDIYKQYMERLEYLELDIYPEEILSLAYLSFFVLAIFLPIILFFTTLNILISSVVFILGFLSYFVILNLPNFLYWYRLIKSLDQSVMAILYLVVYIEVNPNLENALLFTSKFLGGPLGRDFYRIVWYTIIKKYKSVEEGLLDYINRWKFLKPDFVEAINVIIASIKQKQKENRKVMLEKAMEIVLNGTYRQLLRFSAELKIPVTALYMIGLTLPLLILILIPILISFSGGSVDLNLIMVIYDIFLPILIFVIGMYMFSKKPLGFSPPSLKESPFIPRLGYFWVYVGTKRKEINGFLIFLAIFVPLAIPSILYAKHKYIDSINQKPELDDVLYAMPIIIGLGVGTGIYFILISREGVKEARRLETLENEYRMAIFNLAMKIEQGYPLEVALEYVLKSTPEVSPIRKFFEKIIDNIKKFGVDLYTAIFHKKYGAIKEFPSNIIKSTMILFISASKKSIYAAARAMRIVSEYLLKVNDVKEKFKDMLYDVLSSLNFQSSYVAPMVIAVVVSLNALIVVIMQKVSTKAMSFSEFNTINSNSNENTFGFSSGVPAFLQFFAFGGMVPLFHFTLYTYIFLYVSTLIVAYVMKEIESGTIYDFFDKAGKMLISSTLFFVGVTIALTMIFGGVFMSLSTLFGM